MTVGCPLSPQEGVLGGRLVLEVGEGRLCVLPRPGGQRGGTHACAEVRHLALYHGMGGGGPK